MTSKPTQLEEEDSDEFEDAFDNLDDGNGHGSLSRSLSNRTQMDLQQAIQESKLAIDYFFNNRFEEARALMKPELSIYHAVGHSVFLFLEAMLTFEHRSIETASNALKQCLQLCNKHRRKATISESIGKTFKKPNYESYTDLEAHAELCSAEALLLKAMLTFVEDETLASLIKGGMKIRTCFNSYKDCCLILTQRKWESEESKIHFESGVRMGNGTFNLMISLLPSRIIKLLEFIGFSGNKQLGLQDLMIGVEMLGLRQILCTMTLLSYHLIVCYVLSNQDGDLEFCNDLLNKQLTKYPNGVWFLFYKGRLEFMRGNLDEALMWYKKSWRSQSNWVQFHHICFWEILWINSLKLDWREAILFSSYLVEHSKWSRTMYSYQKASLMCMLNPSELTASEKRTIDKLMQDVPVYKQRIAGKSLPMEKFAVRRAERYFQTGKLVLPAIELMYLWNLFKITAKKFTLADGIFKIIEKTIEGMENNPDDPLRKFEVDNKALLLLLKGACMRHMKSPLQAIECLQRCISLQKQIKEDNFIVPYAIVELAFINIDMGDTQQAILCLEDAKKNYTGYSLESRLHFRIHTTLTELTAAVKKECSTP